MLIETQMKISFHPAIILGEYNFYINLNVQLKKREAIGIIELNNVLEALIFNNEQILCEINFYIFF